MTDWEGKRQQINKLLKELQGKPESEKLAHWHNSPGSILNAYREGDLLFDDAVRGLNEWASRKKLD